ncbi:tripartite motif-containing protein 3-like [Argonauta hians]
MEVLDKNYGEQRFNCMVCLCPRLRMVYGKCQHKFCVDCLYNKDNSLRFMSCPLCNQTDQFPTVKPIIPDDNVDIQKCLGIIECPNPGCNYEMWSRDREEHLKFSTPYKEICDIGSSFSEEKLLA